ncbi:MAG: DNA-directed DNA polymerase III alpha subunit [Candidatus Woesebacteria bacterium GW2011_GWA1_41_7]|nr:MAG: DNA-directed DNA polymerase III alpha subunit [Candidatus Woesebacteria bacterium GW2011_GWA1_41_7]
MKIKVLPPDINESDIGFTIIEDKDSRDGKSIRFGFSAIKNVGNAAISSILSSRKDGKFESFADFLGRVDNRKINKKVLESLIKVGAMSKFGGRAALLSAMDSIRDKVGRSKTDDNQQGLFAGSELKKTESAATITIANIEEFPNEELESLERQLLGFSLSAKPISEVLGSLVFESTHKIFEIISSETHINTVKVAAVVSAVRVITTKKTGAEMAFVKLDDGTGTIEVVVFPKVFKDTRDFWNEGKPLIVTGKVDVRDESPGIIVDAIETIGGLGEDKPKEVFINVPRETDVNCLQRLKTLLTENLGNLDAFLVFDGGRKVKLPFKINWNENLAQKISDVLETESS